MYDEVLKARDLLESLTPLNYDCGTLCGSACCAGTEDDGMILLPTEDELYVTDDNFRIETRENFSVLICNGQCDRNDRPFACRLFPLMIHVRDGKAKLKMDPLANAVCPLTEQKITALSKEYLKAVETAAKELLKNEEIRLHFERLTDRIENGMKSDLFNI